MELGPFNSVTQLTSTDEETMKRDLLISEPIIRLLCTMLKMQRSGLDGVVCSPLSRKVHQVCGKIS